MNTTTKSKTMGRRIVGFILVIVGLVVTGIVTWQAAWNPVYVNDVIASLGGTVNLFAILGLIAVGLFLTFLWPRTWPQWVKNALLVVAVIVLVANRDQLLAPFSAIDQIPWIFFGVVVTVIAYIYLLASLLLLDHFPRPNFERFTAWRKKRLETAATELQLREELRRAREGGDGTTQLAQA